MRISSEARYYLFVFFFLLASAAVGNIFFGAESGSTELERVNTLCSEVSCDISASENETWNMVR